MTTLTARDRKPRRAAPQPPERVAALTRVNAALNAFGSAWRSATEANYLTGAAALSYLRTFLAAGPRATRTVALDNLADEAARWDEDALVLPQKALRAKLRERIARLVQVAATVELLTGTTEPPHEDGNGDGKGGLIPWGFVREMGVLVERGDGKQEQWAFLSHVEGPARSLWADVGGGRRQRDELAAAIATVVADRESVLRAAADEEAARLREKQAAAQRAANQLRKEAEVSGLKVERLENASGPAASAELNASMASTLAALLEQQRQATEAQAVAALAGQQAAQAEENAVKGKEREEIARQKARERRQRCQGRQDSNQSASPVDGGEEENEVPPRTHRNLVTMARSGTPKDVASLVVDLVANSSQPDDVLEETLRLLDRHPALSQQGRRIVQAARLQQARSETNAVS